MLRGIQHSCWLVSSFALFKLYSYSDIQKVKLAKKYCPHLCIKIILITYAFYYCFFLKLQFLIIDIPTDSACEGYHATETSCNADCTNFTVEYQTVMKRLAELEKKNSAVQEENRALKRTITDSENSHGTTIKRLKHELCLAKKRL